MNIQSGISTGTEPKKGLMGVVAAKVTAEASLDPTKQAKIAQTTASAVQEALVKVGAVTMQPSAQVSIDASKLLRISGADKAKDSEKLDTAKLDAIKTKIENGDFDIDYAMIANQLAGQSVRRSTSGR